MPAFGTCAGLILLAHDVLDGRADTPVLDAIDCTVRRNAYGTQVRSFEAALDVSGLAGGPFPGVFIRAPAIERAGDGVEVLAEHEGRPVLCRSGAVWVSTFHPELSGDLPRAPGVPDGQHQRGGRPMSGHSKWHSIKHKKGAAQHGTRQALRSPVPGDRGRGAVRRWRPRLECRAAHEDPEGSRRLGADGRHRPAIKRGTGELEGVTYEEVTYEGYAPHGVAVMVECLTDNRNRTGAEIKNIFNRNGGSLAEPGAVSWQFERKGIISLDKAAVSEDDLMLVALDAGAEDITDQGDTWEVTTGAGDLHVVRSTLESAGMVVDSSDLTMLATTTIELDDAGHTKSVLRVIDTLEDHDDTQNVYANFDVPDDVLQAAMA